VLLIVFALTF